LGRYWSSDVERYTSPKVIPRAEGSIIKSRKGDLMDRKGIWIGSFDNGNSMYIVCIVSGDPWSREHGRKAGLDLTYLHFQSGK
jgi:hypothetical protein